MTCCICGKKFFGHGNNPWPIIDDESEDVRCCDECNLNIVVPARIELLWEGYDFDKEDEKE